MFVYRIPKIMKSEQLVEKIYKKARVVSYKKAMK